MSNKWICITLSVVSLLSTSKMAEASQPFDRKELMSTLIRINDKNIPAVLERQLTKKEEKFYGAVFDAESVVSPIGTAQFIQALMCSYVSPESEYYQSKLILDRMTLAAQSMLNLQHSDGTVDLLTTNFHSTPDLGFTIFPLGLSYSVLLNHKQLSFGEFPSLIKQYLLRAGDALSIGGIHTPNHRWVVSAALAWIYSLFPNPKYKSRVEQWLAEKIDIDADGQYYERSTAVYTPITNRSLIDIARKMGYDHLYASVRKNLDLTFYFVHANGEIATESSNRQDQYLKRNMSGYYLAYNYMALLDKDSRYSGMISYIHETVPVEHLIYMLPQFIEDPSLLEALPSPAPIPTSYHKHFKYSDMVRVREGVVDMSIIMNNSTFFTFFKGEAALEGLRLSSAFFGKGQFQSQQMEKREDAYVLTSTIYGPYYQPLPKKKIPKESDAWSKVPRTERKQSEVQRLRTTIRITPENGKARIKISVEGPENLPVTVELGFRSGGVLQNVSSKDGIENAYFIRNGEYATYEKNGNVIRVGPGAVAHKWTQLRGALPKLNGDCLYLTSYAPCELEFTIE